MERMVSGRRGVSRPLVLVAAISLGVLTLGFGVPSAKLVSASKWVKTVCAAETKLHSAVSDKFAALNAALSAGDAAGAKTAFVAFVGALPGPTKTLLSSLGKAGVPKVTNGKKIAQLYVNTDQAVAKALPGMKTQAEGLPTSDTKTFKTAGQKVLNTIKNPTEAATSKILTLDTDMQVNTQLTNCGGVYAVGGGGQSSGGQSGSGQGGGGQGGSTPPPSGQGGGTPPPSGRGPPPLSGTVPPPSVPPSS
jgi:hypothetical protein